MVVCRSSCHTLTDISLRPFLIFSPPLTRLRAAPPALEAKPKPHQRHKFGRNDAVNGGGNNKALFGCVPERGGGVAWSRAVPPSSAGAGVCFQVTDRSAASAASVDGHLLRTSRLQQPNAWLPWRNGNYGLIVANAASVSDVVPSSGTVPHLTCRDTAASLGRLNSSGSNKAETRHANRARARAPAYFFLIFACTNMKRE